MAYKFVKLFVQMHLAKLKVHLILVVINNKLLIDMCDMTIQFILIIQTKLRDQEVKKCGYTEEVYVLASRIHLARLRQNLQIILAIKRKI